MKKGNWLKRAVAITLSAAMFFVNDAFGTMSQVVFAEDTDSYTEKYGIAYEDLFFKAPNYLLRSDAAEYITTLCTNAQSDGLREISGFDTATAVFLEALDSGESYLFNTIFSIATESKAERMEDELLEEILYEYANTQDSYAHKAEEITKQYEKQVQDVAGDLGDLGQAALTELLKKANQTVSGSNIEKMVDAAFKKSDTFMKYCKTTADVIETIITMIEVHEIELSLIGDLMDAQPANSDLTAPLSRFYYKRNSSSIDYFIDNYLVDETISYISKYATKGIWSKGGAVATVIKVCIGVFKTIYELTQPSVSDIVQANLAYSYTKTMERAVSQLQLKFITAPENVDEKTIRLYETAYSFYLTTMRVGMKKIAKSTSDRMKNRLNTFSDLVGDENGLTYEIYIDGCMTNLQSDINKGIFAMPEETAKESIAKGEQAVGTITNFSPRIAPPATNDFHYYNVSGCQNPYVKSGYGMPNCTTYVWGRAWEIAGNNWLTHGSAFTGNADTFWSRNEANNYFPSGQTPAVGAIAVYGPNRFSDVGHVAIVENTDEMKYDEATGRYYGYYISHSSYGGFTWSGNGANNNSVFHYDKVTDTSWEYSWIGTTPLGFIYIYSGEGYDDSHNFVIENGVLTKYTGWQANVVIPDGVTAIGDSAFYNNANIQTVTIPDSVTSIGNYAFAKCTNLRLIEIPDSVTTIGSSAFEECTKLALVGLPYNAEFSIINNYTFKKCKALKSILVPNSVKEIGSYAFSECSSLSKVTLSKSITEMRRGAFYNCDNLTNIEIPKSLEACEEPFADCDNLKDVSFETGTTEIARSLFENCNGLEQITIPDTVTIIEYGAFKNVDNLKEITIPDSVTNIDIAAFSDCNNLKNVKLSYGLVEMGEYAFSNCDALEKIEIPKSLVDIYDQWDGLYTPESPFYDCSNLKNISFQEGSTVIADGLFSGCDGIEQMVIPDTITEIYTNAFSNCINLSDLTIPDSVTNIGTNAFSNCYNLKNVKLSYGLVEIGEYAFSNCDALEKIEIPKSLVDVYDQWDSLYTPEGPFYNCSNLKNISFQEGCTVIADSLFDHCDGIEQIEIPDSVTTIQRSAFSNCTSLNRVVMYEGLEVIESNAFQNCTSLKNITIPNSVNSMGTYIFSGCTALESVTLPNIRQNLMEGTFQNCTSLKEITLPDSLTAIRAKAFYNCDALSEIKIPEKVGIIEGSAFYDCDALAAIALPDGVTSVGSSAFYDCDALTTVTMPNALTTLGNYAFKSCDSLTTVNFGTGLKSIGTETFMDCASLQKVVLPYSMESIGANAFKNDTKFTEIYIPERVTTIDATAFSYPKKITIYGVEGSYAQEFAEEKGIAFKVSEAKPTKVTASAIEVKLNKYEQTQLFATIAPTEYMGNVEWTSSDETIAAVDKNGVVKGVNGGTAAITCKAGDVSATVTVTVEVPVSYIILKKSSIEIEKGESYTIEVSRLFPEDATNKQLLFESEDETIATVDEEGKITGIKEGDTNIIVKSKDGNAQTTCEITVIKPIPKITLNSDNVVLEAGEFFTLTASILPEEVANQGLTYESQDPSVATVDANGKITAVANGTTVIIVKTEDGRGEAKCKVVVTKKISLTCNQLTLRIGETRTLPAVLTDITGDLVWTSSDSSIAEVSSNGDVSAKAVGEATITLSTPDGKYKDTCVVTVKPQTVLTLNAESLSLNIGDTFNLATTITPEEFANQYVFFSSDNYDVASVDASGKITAVGNGTATITAFTGDGYGQAVCLVTVSSLPFSIGDVNQDSQITAEDALAVLKYVVGLDMSINPELADCDGNSEVTAEDALWILKKVVGLIP